MEVHEHPVLQGEVGVMNNAIIHNDYKGYETYLARHNAYSSWEAERYLSIDQKAMQHMTRRQRLKYRLLGSWLLGPLYFFGAYFIKGGLLDGKEGFMLAINKMMYFMQIKCKIEELKKVKQTKV